jgi:hypothetical protein
VEEKAELPLCARGYARFLGRHLRQQLPIESCVQGPSAERIPLARPRIRPTDVADL